MSLLFQIQNFGKGLKLACSFLLHFEENREEWKEKVFPFIYSYSSYYLFHLLYYRLYIYNIICIYIIYDIYVIYLIKIL